jgi:transketolase
MQQRAIHEVSTETLQDKAKMVRRETVRLTDICGSGHYGSAFSIAELLACESVLHSFHLTMDHDG